MSPRRTDHTRGPLFRLGQLVATPGAIEVMERLGIDPLGLVARHVTGDWGDLDADDCAVNETALVMGGRIFSAYGAQGDDRLWVITDGAVRPVDEDGRRDRVQRGPHGNGGAARSGTAHRPSPGGSPHRHDGCGVLLPRSGRLG